MLLVAVRSARFTLGNLAELRDDGRAFSPLSAAFFALLFGVEALPIHPEVLWIYTLAHMSLNNNNNNNTTTTTTTTTTQPQHTSTLEVPTTTGYVFAVVAVQTMGWPGSTCSVRAAHRQSRAGYKYWTGLRRVRAPVVDVPVIISDMLQQFFVKNVEVPQTEFFDRVVVRLLSQRQGCTVQTVQKTGDSPGAVL